MIKFRFAALVGIPAAAALIALSGCGSGSTNGAVTGGSLSGVTKAAGPRVTIHYKVVAPDSDLARTGPDGQKHDTFWAVDPTTAHVGDRVTIVVDNYDDMMHGMFFPELGITKMIAAGEDDQPTQTTFSFTATRAGTFRWYCPVPCDTDNGQWAMKADGAGPGQDGFMAGTVTVS